MQLHYIQYMITMKIGNFPLRQGNLKNKKLSKQ